MVISAENGERPFLLLSRLAHRVIRIPRFSHSDANGGRAAADHSPNEAKRSPICRFEECSADLNCIQLALPQRFSPHFPQMGFRNGLNVTPRRVGFRDSGGGAGGERVRTGLRLWLQFTA